MTQEKLSIRNQRAGYGPRERALALICAGLLMLIMGCLRGPPLDRPVASDPEARSQQVATLEESIARDRRRLEELVTEPRNEAAEPLHSDAVLREIAERITAQAKLLEALQSQPDGSTLAD